MDGLLALDGQILLFIQEHLRFDALNGVVRAITMSGDSGAIWIVLTLVLLCFRRTRRAGVASALALAFGFLMTNVALKNIIHRVRPYDAMEALNLLVRPESDWSFPSGHATSSFAAAWALRRRLPGKWGAPAVLLAALISLSRLYVGVHYPTDVLAGAVIGLVAAALAVRAQEKLEARRA